MAEPTRVEKLVELLPTLYYRDPVLRRVLDAVAGRLAETQGELREVMNAHWVDRADPAPPGAPQPLVDLPRIAALVPLVPFPDEETARPAPETVMVDAASALVARDGGPLPFAELVIGQRLFAVGTRSQNGALVASRVQAGRAPEPGPAEESVDGPLLESSPATAVEPLARLVLAVGPSGAELFRRRLKLTVEALLEGAGTAPAILKMVAATMGWGRLEGTFADWSARWTEDEPVFEARAAGASGPIVLRELPLVAATTPVPHAVKSGSRWVESNDSPRVVAPRVRFRALDRPVLIPTLVNLDAEVAIAIRVTLETVKRDGEGVTEQEVTLRLEGRSDGTLEATLVERPSDTGGVTETDVTDRIRVVASGLRIDREGAAAHLRGGGASRAAGLTLSDGQRALRLTARGEGGWAHGVRVASTETPETVELAYDPALAVGGGPSPEEGIYRETLTLDDLLAGASRLVAARALTLTIPEGESRWLYFDHQGPGAFDRSAWDQAGFADPSLDGADPEALLESAPARAPWDYATFGAAVFSPEPPRVFRFDRPDSVYGEAVFSELPEQVEILLSWSQGQRATLRLDLPVTTPREFGRLAFLPRQLRKVKAAGIKVLLVPRSLVREVQPLGERPPVVRPRLEEHQALGETVRLRERRAETQPLGERVAGVYDHSHADHAHFGASVEGAFERSHWNRVDFV